MQIFQQLAGYSLGQADMVRRAMSKKKAKDIARERDAFIHGDKERNITGCVANGIPAETAEAIYDEIYDFANYAFNKAHAVSYAVVAYQTAYFKYHFTKEYMAALFDLRAGQLRQGGGVHQRVQGLRHRPAAAGHQPLRRPLHRGGGGNPLRPRGHQEHRPGLHPGGDAPAGAGTFHVPLRFLRPHDGQRHQQAGGREPDPQRRVLTPLGAKRSQLIHVYESVMDAVADSHRQNLDGQMDFFSMAAGTSGQE